MNGLKLGVLINTTNKQEEACIQMDIIRNTWSELFKDVVIVHVYNGDDEFINYKEDESVLCDNPNNFEGAANMMDKGMYILKKYDLDYIIVSASDCRWTQPEKLMSILIEMKLNNKYLASCPWGHAGQDDRKSYGLACDTFIVDAKREKEHHIFPLAYGDFHKKYMDVLHYFGRYNITVENLLSAKFISACANVFSTSQVKNVVHKSLYIIRERIPMMTDSKRNFDCPKLGLYTNHLPLTEKIKCLQK